MPWTTEAKRKAKGKGFEKHLTAGELAKLIGVHKLTILRRIESGALVPDGGSNARGWWLFSPQQAKQILRARSEGKWDVKE